MKKLKLCMLCGLLLWCNMAVMAQGDIITQRGDRYVINVEALNPDSEMTLMDVILMCPEMVSTNGKTLVSSYSLRINNTTLALDREAVLKNIKASELSRVQICTYTSTAKGVDRARGVIDIYYKENTGTHGKVAVEGSTYGNGILYTDIISRIKNVELSGYALTNQQYGKGSPWDGGSFTTRRFNESAHLNIDWDITKNDNLMLKFYQQFTDTKDRHNDIAVPTVLPGLDRYGKFVACYTRTLNENGAILIVEGGADYTNTKVAQKSYRDTWPYFYTELNMPTLNNDLWIMAGWEFDYNNHWLPNERRQQYMHNDLYLQLDYSHGPWVITLGDRFRHMNFWNRMADPSDNGLWSHNRNENSYHASVGYKIGKNFVQGFFNRDYCIPGVDDFYEGLDGNLKATYNTDYVTNLVWRTEARYTFQTENLAFQGNVLHMWKNDMPTPNEQTTGIRTAVTWHKGAVRITAGANYYHHHINATDLVGGQYENYYNLKLAPTVLLGKGFRVSSVLMYNSRQKLNDYHPHLNASVKVNKDFGRHFNVYADFHDLAGMPTMSSDQMSGMYSNRALTLGMTYRFGGK